jgi:hypothetical protein
MHEFSLDFILVHLLKQKDAVQFIWKKNPNQSLCDFAVKTAAYSLSR